MLLGRITYESCESKEDVPIASCSGACQSSASFQVDSPYFRQDCSCCRPTEFEVVLVPMSCGARKRAKNLTYNRIKKCVCSPCESTPTKDQSPARTQDSIFSDKMKAEDAEVRDSRSISGRIYDMIFGNNE